MHKITEILETEAVWYIPALNEFHFDLDLGFPWGHKITLIGSDGNRHKAIFIGRL